MGGVSLGNGGTTLTSLPPTTPKTNCSPPHTRSSTASLPQWWGGRSWAPQGRSGPGRWRCRSLLPCLPGLGFAPPAWGCSPSPCPRLALAGRAGSGGGEHAGGGGGGFSPLDSPHPQSCCKQLGSAARGVWGVQMLGGSRGGLNVSGAVCGGHLGLWPPLGVGGALGGVRVSSCDLLCSKLTCCGETSHVPHPHGQSTERGVTQPGYEAEPPHPTHTTPGLGGSWGPPMVPLPRA